MKKKTIKLFPKRFEKNSKKMHGPFNLCFLLNIHTKSRKRKTFYHSINIFFPTIGKKNISQTINPKRNSKQKEKTTLGGRPIICLSHYKKKNKELLDFFNKPP